MGLPYFSIHDFQRYQKALAFAACKHANQRRKNRQASPYINHPLSLVTVLLQEANVWDMDVLIASLLHDVLEDTATTYDELHEQFGGQVAELVDSVSDDKSLPKQDRKRLQIEHASSSPHRVRLIKLADKICNLRDLLDEPMDWPLARKQEYFDWAKAVVDEMRGTHPVLEALFDEVYAQRHRLCDN